MDVYIESPTDFLMYGGGEAFRSLSLCSPHSSWIYWNNIGGGVGLAAAPAQYDAFITNLAVLEPLGQRQQSFLTQPI